MPSLLRKISAFEEATFGRAFSLTGLKYLGAAVVAGEVMHQVTEAWKSRNDPPEVQATPQSDPREWAAGEPAEISGFVIEQPLQQASGGQNDG